MWEVYSLTAVFFCLALQLVPSNPTVFLEICNLSGFVEYVGEIVPFRINRLADIA